MDWNIKKNTKFFLLLFVLCALIPHGMLSLLEMASTSDNWSPAEIESYSNFFVCQWTPFWAAHISYLRLQKKDNFSLLPAISFALILLTFLPRFQQTSVLTIALTIPLILAVELTALLKKTEFSKNKVLAGISADRRLIRVFFFWSVVFHCVAFISCEACTWHITVVSPFLMFPIPGILLFDVFRHQKDQPPTVWGVIGMLAMVPLSLFLVTIGPMERFKVYHLMSLGIGYVSLFVMLIVYNMDHWRKPKADDQEH